MSLKVAVIVGVVLVALFVGSVVLGARQDDGSSTDRNALLDRLGDVAGDPSAVPRSQIVAGCVADDHPDLLKISGGCTVLVRNKGDLRLLRMQALDPITIDAPAPDGDLEVNSDVDAGKEVSVAVGKGETEVRVSCRGGALSTCRARLVVG